MGLKLGASEAGDQTIGSETNDATADEAAQKTTPVQAIPVADQLPTEEIVAKKQRRSLWSVPRGKGRFRIVWWIYTWPIKCLLTLTIPCPKTWRRLYPLTFIMCVIFIGINAYMIVWMLTVTGEIRR